MFRGTLALGPISLDCHVLDDGRRVFTQGEIVRAISGGRDSSDLGRYLRASPLKDLDFSGGPIRFQIPGNPQLSLLLNLRGRHFMPVAEISAAVTSLNATLQIAKAMVGLRDAEAFRAKSIEMQQTIMDALDNGIAAREAYTAQLDRVRALEAEVADLKAWNTDKQNYELTKAGDGAVAFMLKPDTRGTEIPHWLCPNCFSNGKKSFLNPTGRSAGRGWTFKCSTCNAEPACWSRPQWNDAPA